MEIWKDIQGYEGYYKISNYGQVKNIKTGNTITGDINSTGYRRVWLYNPVKKRFFVHHLVALNFCNGYQDNLVVNHKDGNKLNNKFDNLEWVTRSENDIHAFKMQLRNIYPCQYKKHIQAYDKNTLEFVKEYNNTKECEDDLGVARSNIYNCCNGKQKSCRGYILKYKE